jgi:hypothetical protein
LGGDAGTLALPLINMTSLFVQLGYKVACFAGRFKRMPSAAADDR